MAAQPLRPGADLTAISAEVNALIADASEGAAGNVSGGVALRIVRGRVNAVGAVVSGEGFTPAKGDTGQYSLTWDTPFAVAPSLVATLTSSVGVIYTAPSTSVSGVFTFNSSFVAADGAFSFIAIGAA